MGLFSSWCDVLGWFSISGVISVNVISEFIVVFIVNCVVVFGIRFFGFVNGEVVIR